MERWLPPLDPVPAPRYGRDLVELRRRIARRLERRAYSREALCEDLGELYRRYNPRTISSIEHANTELSSELRRAAHLVAIFIMLLGRRPTDPAPDPLSAIPGRFLNEKGPATDQ